MRKHVYVYVCARVRACVCLALGNLVRKARAAWPWTSARIGAHTVNIAPNTTAHWTVCFPTSPRVVAYITMRSVCVSVAKKDYDTAF